MTLTEKDLVNADCKCGKTRKEIIPQVKAVEQTRILEQERILLLLGNYHNAAWRRHHLEAITKLIKGN